MLSLHSHIVLRALRCPPCVGLFVACDRAECDRGLPDSLTWFANSWMVGPLPSQGQAPLDHDGAESEACRPRPSSLECTTNQRLPSLTQISRQRCRQRWGEDLGRRAVGLDAPGLDEDRAPGGVTRILGLVADESMVKPRVARKRSTRSSISRRCAGPSAAKGSSSSSSGLLRTRLRASAARWRSPPESWPGWRASTRRARPAPALALTRRAVRRLSANPGSRPSPTLSAREMGKQIMLLEQRGDRPARRHHARHVVGRRSECGRTPAARNRRSAPAACFCPHRSVR